MTVLACERSCLAEGDEQLYLGPIFKSLWLWITDKLTQHAHSNIPHIFDHWADPVVHLLLLQCSLALESECLTKYYFVNHSTVVYYDPLAFTARVRFFKNEPLPASIFLYLLLVNTVDSKQIFNINFANDWI